MITEFRIGCSHTRNLQDFNSIKVEASITVSLMDDEDFEKAKAQAQLDLRKLLEETYRAQKRERAT